MIKIAIDARYLEDGGGGIGRCIAATINYLSKNNYKIFVISTRPIKYLPGNVKNIILRKRFNWIVWEQIQLPYLLLKLRPDIYHAAGNWGVPLIRFCPTVVTIYDIIPLLLPGYFSESKIPVLSYWLYYIRIKIALSFSNKIICISNEVLEEIQIKYKINKSKITVIPMGITDSIIQNINNNSKYTMNTLRINKPYILSHGGLDLRKNTDKLIEAFKRLKGQDNEKFSNLQLIITGKNPDIKYKLKKLVTKFELEDYVRFVGYVSDAEIAELVQHAKLVVYSSTAEGFGIPPLEAMACKVPVVTSDIPVIKYYCKNIPIYIIPNNIDSIYKGMIKGLTVTLSEDILEKGRRIALEYTWEKTAIEVQKVYNDVLANS